MIYSPQRAQRKTGTKRTKRTTQPKTHLCMKQRRKEGAPEVNCEAGRLEGGGVWAAGRLGDLGEGAIYDLVDSVDRFLLARAATKNENLGDEVILRVVGGVREMRSRFAFGNHFRDAHGLTTTAANDSTEVLRGDGGGRHRQSSLDKTGEDEVRELYKKPGKFVYHRITWEVEERK